jgi:hypothetical protein
MLKKYRDRTFLNFPGGRYVAGGCCEHGYELSDSI